MPKSFRPRATRCTHCDDTVLIVEETPKQALGIRRSTPATTISLEHADPGPDGEVFDPVDDGCRRARVHWPYPDR